MVLGAIDEEATVPDAIGITAGYAAKMRVKLGLIRSGVVEAENNVVLLAVLSRDKEVRNGCAVGDEQSADALGGDLVFTVCVGAERVGVVGREGVVRNGRCNQQEETSRRHDCAHGNAGPVARWSRGCGV